MLFHTTVSIEGTVMQIEKALINDRLHDVAKVPWKSCIPTIYNFAIICPWNFAIFLKSSLLVNSFYCLFCLENKHLRLNRLKTTAAMNARISVFVICVEAIIYFLLHNLHDCSIKLYILTYSLLQQRLRRKKIFKCVNLTHKFRLKVTLATKLFFAIK